MPKERNLQKKKWDASKLTIALVYPNTYVAMAGLTIQTLYQIWNSHPGVICERFFLPSREPNKLKRRPGTVHVNPQGSEYPPLRSLENNMPLKDFDMVAFSVSYELDYPNILWILENGGIPKTREERYEDDRSQFPVILAGGHVIRSNPLPISSFIDAAFIGEVEPINDAFLEAWFAAHEDPDVVTVKDINTEFLAKLKYIAGFWIPSKQTHEVQRVYAKNLDDIPHPIAQVVPIFAPEEKNPLPFTDSLFVEVNRGCPNLCRFCITGCQLKPFRNRSLAKLQEIIEQGLRATKLQKVVLIGSSVTAHPKFTNLVKYLLTHKISFSIPSIRIDEMTAELARLLAQSGMKTVAIAPEAGSNDLRRRVGKKITNRQILEGIKMLHDAGIPNIKLYFLYGLPMETDQDLLAIVSLSREIAQLGYGKWGVRLSVNPFIPKAHTPFERAIDLYLDPKLEELRRRYEVMYQPLKGNRQIKWEALSLEEAYVQMLLALGDTTFGSLISEFYGTGKSIKKWYRRITRATSPHFRVVAKYLRKLQKHDFGDHPWNFVDQGLPIKLLRTEWDKASRKE